MNKRELKSLARRSLEAAVDGFVTVPGMPTFKWPVDGKLSSRSLLANCTKDVYDEILEAYPWEMPVENLVAMAWDRIMDSSSLSFEALQLDGQTWLYFESTDSAEDSLYLLAVAETDSPRRTHHQFLTERFRSNDFLMCPPTEIASSFPRPFLAECFAVAADVAIKHGWTTSEDFWEAVRQTITQHKPNSPVLSRTPEEKDSGRALLMDEYLAALLPS